MHTKRSLAGTMAVLTALLMTLHSPADAQRRGDQWVDEVAQRRLDRAFVEHRVGVGQPVDADED